MGLKTLLIVTRLGFVLAVLGLFITITSYFSQHGIGLGIALLISGIIVFAIGALMESRSKYTVSARQ
jgi:drug/metabolite transporter (DMT)-like permease